MKAFYLASAGIVLLVLVAGPALGDDRRYASSSDPYAGYADRTPDDEIASLRRQLAREIAKVRETRRQLEAELARVEAIRDDLARRRVVVGRSVTPSQRVVVRTHDRHQRVHRVEHRPVVVTVSGGKLEFFGKHRPYEPFAVELRPGETKRVRYDERGGRRYDHLEISRSHDGHTVLFGSNGWRPLRYVDTGWAKGKGVTYAAKSAERAGGEPQRVCLNIRVPDRYHARGHTFIRVDPRRY